MTNMISLESLQVLITHELPARFHSLDRSRLVKATCALGAFYTLFKVGQAALRWRRTTALRGPPSSSTLWGLENELQIPSEAALLYEKWTEEYGGAFVIPTAFGTKTTMFSDPKAIAHYFAHGATIFIQPHASQAGAEHLLGKGLLTSYGEDHRRQRKSFTPAFSNAALRNLSTVMYDLAYKVKGFWDPLIESNGGSAVLDVQDWVKRISLDVIGITGFSHDFGALDDKQHPVGDALRDLNNVYTTNFMQIFGAFAMVFPFLMNFPNPYSNNAKKLNDAMGDIAEQLLSKTRKEKQAGTLGLREEESMLGLLIKAENLGKQRRLTRQEAAAQAKILLLAAFDTTSLNLVWVLVDLCKNPDVQKKLRSELVALGSYPTYDQLANNLLYLDAVVHESLRMHPPHSRIVRRAAKDDVVPLSKPIYTRSGKLVDHVYINKESIVVIPLASVNRSAAFWGPDAKKFNPERWIDQDGIPGRAKEIQGHRHLLTFSDGPRICPGRWFAIAQIKIIVAILVKNFMFEFVDGPKTEIAMAPGMVPRPKVAGAQGDAIPMLVTRV